MRKVKIYESHSVSCGAFDEDTLHLGTQSARQSQIAAANEGSKSKSLYDQTGIQKPWTSEMVNQGIVTQFGITLLRWQQWRGHSAVSGESGRPFPTDIILGRDWLT